MPPVDRAKTSPFLLRCFIRANAHNDIAAFNPNSPALQAAEYGIYVWKDTTLRELVILLRSVGASYQRPGNAKFSIRHVYAALPSSSSAPSRRPGDAAWDYKDLGHVFARDLAGKNALEEGSGRGGGRNDPSVRTLEQHRIIPGDFVDIAFVTAPPGGAGGPSSSFSSSQAPGSSISRVVPLPGGSGAPMNSLSARLGGAGPSEADRAWGIAGDLTQRRRPMSGTGGPSGANRLNPLLATNGNNAGGSVPRGELSIMGAGRRNEISINGAARRESRDYDRRRESRDGERDMSPRRDRSPRRDDLRMRD